MLPGLMRMPATPASTAATASPWSKWMSAISGTGDSRHQRGQRRRGRLVRHGHPHDGGAGRGQRPDLRERGLDVVGLGVGHRLDGRPARRRPPATSPSITCRRLAMLDPLAEQAPDVVGGGQDEQRHEEDQPHHGYPARRPAARRSCPGCFSMMLKSTCPPSSGSSGSMLRMARLTLMKASSIR